MLIDIFKDNLFEPLSKYNQEIYAVCDKHKIQKFGLGIDTARGDSCWWFDPRRTSDLPLTTSWNKTESVVYPEPEQFVYGKEFCLSLYAPNYVSLFLITKLFPDKSTLIEDWACGLSQLTFFLSKLGYNNFSHIENFSQISEGLAKDMWEHISGNKSLNNDQLLPKVINIVGYHPYTKTIPHEVELLLVYPKKGMIDTFLSLKGYTNICTDSHKLLYAFAREDKAEEFRKVLEGYEVH